jgi:hypothetical protein
MSFVKCSVDGCNTRLQPILKPDPRDRESWLYRECDLCFRAACEKHATEIDGRIICDRCRRSELPPAKLLDLDVERLVPRKPGREEP